MYLEIRFRFQRIKDILNLIANHSRRSRYLPQVAINYRMPYTKPYDCMGKVISTTKYKIELNFIPQSLIKIASKKLK